MAEFKHHAPHSCGSSDGLAVYDDGTGFCFVCGTYESQGEEVGMDNRGEVVPASSSPPPGEYRPTGEYRALVERGISEATCRKYGYCVVIVTGEHFATYHDAEGRPVAWKVRGADKAFRWMGEPKRAGLFGHQLWKRGGKRVVVTEGEIDALTVAQLLDNRWPVVSVPNGAAAAKRDVTRNLEWLETYEQVVLMFDEDEPGRQAAEECAQLLSPGKARIARLPRKDANECLLKGEGDAVVRAVWEAREWRPDGIVSGADLWERVHVAPTRGIPYPWRGLDDMLYGQRRREIVTWCGGTGVGKTELVGAVAHALLLRGESVGVVSLEESVAHAALRQVSLAVGRRLHVPGSREGLSEEELRTAFDRVLARAHFLDHFGAVDEGSLGPRIRYMAKALGVGWIVLDHLSFLAGGEDERKQIDNVMRRVRSLAEELELCVHLVSHLRRPEHGAHEEGARVTLADLRGSGMIGGLSNIVVAAERDTQTGDGTTTLRVLKNRHTGHNGVACRLRYDGHTGIFTEEGTGEL